MIHQELNGAFVVEADGSKSAVELRSPRDLLEATEDSAPPGDAMLCAIEAVRDWLGWIFEAGPHPLPVMRRLVACTLTHAPGLLLGLPAREVRAVSAGARATESLREICHTTPRAVNAALAQAYRREGRTWSPAQVISTLEMRLVIESALAQSDALIRASAMRTWLARVWDHASGKKAGPRLGEAMKALYVEARTLAPEMILNMSGEEIAALFAQGRAAESARVKQRVNTRLLRAGYRGATLRFQKSLTACRTYAECQRGNRNRALSGGRAVA